MIDLKILAIDTSGKVASVAVTDGEKLLWEKSIHKAHSLAGDIAYGEAGTRGNRAYLY